MQKRAETSMRQVGLFAGIVDVGEAQMSYSHWSESVLGSLLRDFQKKDDRVSFLRYLKYAAPGTRIPEITGWKSDRSQSMAPIASANRPDWAAVAWRLVDIMAGSLLEKEIGSLFEAKKPVFWMHGDASPQGLPDVVAIAIEGREQPTCQVFLESVMRRIELKKNVWFQLESGDVSRLHTAARLYHLLVEASWLTRDWRFLNTALKLNDWLFPAILKFSRSCHLRGGEEDAEAAAFHYAFGLLQQERALNMAVKV